MLPHAAPWQGVDVARDLPNLDSKAVYSAPERFSDQARAHAVQRRTQREITSSMCLSSTSETITQCTHA